MSPPIRREASRRFAVAARQRAAGASAQSAVRESASALRRVPHVRTPADVVLPRVLAIAADLLGATGIAIRTTLHYLHGNVPDRDRPQHERALAPDTVLKLLALEEFTRAPKSAGGADQPQRVSDLIGSLRELSEARGKICWSR